MHKMRFYLDISSREYQRYYEGTAKAVQVKSDDGRSLRFPVSSLQKYVSHSGVKGHFEIVFDDDYRLVELNRV